MARKLASIQKIESLKPIQGADSIELARVLGWNVVVKKGEFKEGDNVVYCEIDSVMPDNDKKIFEFLRPRKFRIKTIKLKGQVSQGICFPINILDSFTEKRGFKIDDDVTDIIGIVKYELPIPANLMGIIVGNFPSFIPKTDETRVQLLQNVITRYKDTECYITEKLDGTSCTFFIKDGTFGVCSRNLQLKESDDNVHWQMAKQYDIENKLKSLGKNIAIQGEIIGFGIQKNTLKLRDKRFYAFNVFDIDSFKYYNYEETMKLLNELKILNVPIVTESFSLIDDIDELVKLSNDKSKIYDGTIREGIVIRPKKEIIDLEMSNHFSSNGRLSFKVINPEYLLKNE